MSFYNLPHPWDPGYAIPKYVMGEPPERGVFVTQWLPRGTIPTLVPEYLAGPGKKLLGRADADLGSLSGSCLGGSSLGGSTLTGHTLRGHSLGATEYQLHPTGLAGGGRADYGAYGQKAAAKMIAAVKQLPSAARAGALKAAMQRLDATLPARCEAYAEKARAAGATPAAALQAGLARAISEGLLGELAKTGRSRRAPHPESLLGMGCNRARSALGATFDATYSASQVFGSGGSGAGYHSTTTAPAPASSAPATGSTTVSDPRCPNPPPGYTWSPASAGKPGMWTAISVRNPTTPVPYPGVLTYPGCSVDVREHAADETTGSPGTAGGKKLEIGPPGSGFLFPVDNADRFAVRIHSPQVIPLAWKSMIRGAWTTAFEDKYLKVPSVEAGGTTNGFDLPAWNAMVRPWLDALGIPAGTRLNAGRMFSNHVKPFVFKHPVDGKDWGLSIAIPVVRADGSSGSGVYQAGSTVPAMVAQVSKIPDVKWYQRVAGAVIDVTVAVGSAIQDAVEAVVDLTCQLMNTPGAAQGAAAATGGTAAAAGVILAQQAICGQTTPTAPQLPLPPPGNPYLLPLAIGGGVLLLVAAAASRRR